MGLHKARVPASEGAPGAAPELPSAVSVTSGVSRGVGRGRALQPPQDRVSSGSASSGAERWSKAII